MAEHNKDASFSEIKRIGKLSADGVFVYDISRQCFTFLNSAMVKILEINKKLLMEEAALVLHLIPEDDHEYVQMRFAELFEKQSVQDAQIRIVQNKTKKSLSCSCYISADGSSIVGFVKDMSKPREHEEYLVNYGARKDAILDMVSQNLSTPLNLSKFTIDLIEKAVKEKKYHKLDAHLGVMREVTADSIRIIDNFLQEEHLESPKVYPKPNRFDVISKLLIVLERLKEAHPDKRFHLKSEAKHLFLTADEMKFFQIVHNLLSNAVKFTRHKGLIETIVRESRDKVEIIVKDDGIGIPENLKPYIFEKKTRAARPGLNGEISNGIGLYIIKKLVDILGGKISFESKENRGTTFILELPKKQGG
jgi:two-component system, OmpR family, sensor histidine kinase VicK